MGCDIHSHAERKTESGKWEAVPGLLPFSSRSYGTFGFLADVRNYSGLTPIAPPRGFPADASGYVVAEYEGWGGDAHTPSWLSVEELTAFDYDAICEDRRVTRQVGPGHYDGGYTCDPGEGKQQTYRDFLGPWFFEDLQKLQAAGAERVVFWFDN
jgi:hypothetical protein